MNRSELIKFHTEEAASYERSAALVPGTPAGRQCAELAADHRDLAEAARVGDYPHPSEHIVGTDI
jgi:hypothetical protein